MTDLREKIEPLLRDYIKVDATGLAPVVSGHFITGFESAADAIMELILSAKEEMRERAVRVAETYSDGEPSDTWEQAAEIASLEISQAIRSLPLEGVSLHSQGRAVSPPDRSPEGSPPDGCSSLTQDGGSDGL